MSRRSHQGVIRAVICATAGAGVLAWLWPLPSSRADEDPPALDATLTQQLRGGPPAGASPLARQTLGRTGVTPHELPAKPKVLVRTRVQGGIVGGPAVDETGRIVVATGISRIVQLTPRGKLDWSRPTGTASPATGPVLMSDGTRVAVTTSGEVFGYSPTGARRFHRFLGGTGDVTVDPLPLADGSVLVARGRELVRLGPRGALQGRAQTPSAIVALLAVPSRGRKADVTPLVVVQNGSVLRWRVHEEPITIGSFSGSVRGGVIAVSKRHLLAVVDNRRLVELDLRTRTRHERWASPGATLSRDLTAWARDEAKSAPKRPAYVVTSDGLLLGHDSEGSELRRVALEPYSGFGGDAGALSFGGTGSGPAPIVGTKKRLAFLRAGLELGVLSADGRIERAEGATCSDPIALVGAGEKRLVAACSSGLLFVVSPRD